MESRSSALVSMMYGITHLCVHQFILYIAEKGLGAITNYFAQTHTLSSFALYISFIYWKYYIENLILILITMIIYRKVKIIM